MTDNLSKSHRSWNMSQIRGKNTKPELAVRSLLHHMGYRFRLHVQSLPGKPDIVLSKYNTCIFVHGCFWHRHPKCKDATIPKTKSEFWLKKLQSNVDRDVINVKKLKNLGWHVLTIWECELNESEKLETKLSKYLKRNIKEIP
jgi:DNA mismatch endonuclease, patch repair protein